MAFQLALHVLGGPAHPQQNVADDGNGDEAADAAHNLLANGGQRLGAVVDDCEGGDGGGERGGYADPDPPHLIGAAGFLEVGGEDHDDHRGLKALAQADEEVGKSMGILC